jgi:hypothetical protein
VIKTSLTRIEISNPPVRHGSVSLTRSYRNDSTEQIAVLFSGTLMCTVNKYLKATFDSSEHMCNQIDLGFFGSDMLWDEKIDRQLKIIEKRSYRLQVYKINVFQE